MWEYTRPLLSCQVPFIIAEQGANFGGRGRGNGTVRVGGKERMGKDKEDRGKREEDREGDGERGKRRDIEGNGEENRGG